MLSGRSLHLRLPATSANLGPGFDTAGLAMELWLEIEAEEAASETIEASGRDVDAVRRLDGNLILDTYRQLAAHGPALRLRIRNDIPLGMGCGSSAAALLAGVLLANHFGELGLTPDEVLNEACRREGHPDNVAACFHGGFTVSSIEPDGRVVAASFGGKLDWQLVLVMPTEGLSTAVARNLLPERYPRAEAVANVQATAMLVAAFALGRLDLLTAGTRDALHQPYRSQVCPLLPQLLPLSGSGGVRSVTLSGAGPAVLLILDPGASLPDVHAAILEATGVPVPELVGTRIARGTQITTRNQEQVTEDTC